MSKKIIRNKRYTVLPRTSEYSNLFKKSWENLSRSARYDMNELKEVMLLLIANDAPLEPKWKDHQLHGKYEELRECHIGGDFLLIYKLNSTKNHIVFFDAGTHSELFR